MSLSGRSVARASIIIVTFNSISLIPHCLDALLATIERNDEVLVVDNNSTDGTADLIRDRYPTVRLARLQTNVGFAAGCNHGARLATGACLLFLNPDTQPQPGSVSALVEHVQQNPNVLATAKLLSTQAPGRVDTFGNDIHLSGVTTRHLWGKDAQTISQDVELTAISGACFAIASAAFQTLGGFDERFFLYYEDIDLSLRARYAGYRCIGIASACVLHEAHPVFSAAKARYLERGRWWTLLKVCRLRTLIALLPTLLLAEGMTCAWAVREGPPFVLAKLLAWIDVLSWLPQLPAARARTAPRLCLSDREIWGVHSPTVSLAQVDGPRRAEQMLGLLFRLSRSIASRCGLM
jgi:GT2 family glycosyltransferase